MPLSHQDQVNLLKDILSNQQTDCCGSVAEYQQLERLIKSLMVNTNVDGNIKSILQDVYQYSQHGVNASDMEQHIQTNQGQLSQWVNDIGSFS
ncbi:YtzH-like family protein [Mesobacillus subterraneus]|uniref:YtzH-like family protein n=1 Tax=Mesobacillus subterraneus TaxID=285983 RepID=UPI001CFDBC0C|nr:YtzH-like family protein [Mesobacillus subterraneus]WLR56026.1 YtzH-like family protein [Mesobacillus subterraneus]